MTGMISMIDGGCMIIESMDLHTCIPAYLHTCIPAWGNDPMQMSASESGI
jgi:hypothetical protein